MYTRAAGERVVTKEGGRDKRLKTCKENGVNAYRPPKSKAGERNQNFPLRRRGNAEENKKGFGWNPREARRKGGKNGQETHTPDR